MSEPHEIKKTAARIAEEVEAEMLAMEPHANAHIATEGMKGAVMMLAAFRIPQADIAKAMKISVPTLTKYYRHELENAQTIVKAEVLKAWMNNVRAGKELTILRFMEQNFSLNGTDSLVAALPRVVLIDDVRDEDAVMLETNIPKQG